MYLGVITAVNQSERVRYQVVAVLTDANCDLGLAVLAQLNLM